MPEIGMYHFIFRFVEEVSLQLSQDKTSEGMSLMENGGKATLCSFRFTRHVHQIINVIILSTKIKNKRAFMHVNSHVYYLYTKTPYKDIEIECLYIYTPINVSIHTHRHTVSTSYSGLRMLLSAHFERCYFNLTKILNWSKLNWCINLSRVRVIIT